MGSFPIIKRVFNRGPFPTAGGSAIVNATGWNTLDGYQVNWVPSMRMIVDLSNLNNSLSMHTTGQSGHPYHPHYIDMADPWRFIQYQPMYWELNEIEANASERLTLIPGDK
jgi:penicillin amidase